jgi:hypothetical protein
MIPTLDLMLGTLERALAVAVLPAAGNAAAREEASLGILFTRWIRDVVDHVADAERASCDDCRAALADAVALAAEAGGGELASFREEARAFLDRPLARTAAAVRADARLAKSLLVRSLRAARADRSDVAPALRRLLADLGARELEREIAFGRITGIDPDGAEAAPLGEVLARWQARRSRP